MYAHQYPSGVFSYQYVGSHTHTNASFAPPTQNMAEEVIHPTGMGFVGLPIRFDSGQFSGMTICTELHEIQKADLGRKYARVDRRPLDPPPVVEMRLFEVQDSRDTEISNYENVQVLGFLCTVDLFPVIGPEFPRTPPSSRSGHRKTNSTSSSTSATSSVQSRSPHAVSLDSYAHAHNVYPPTASAVPPPTSMPYSSNYPQNSPSSPDIVHYVDNVPITESSKMTDSLVGATFVQPQIIDYQGRKTLIFVFSDLAVKTEGIFILRYRVFDLYSTVQGQSDRVIQAECYGGSFRVYSTKEFPGLQASTSLTKLISRYGVRLNIRETERKRRKKGETRDENDASASGKGKRKHSVQNLEDEEEGASEDD